MEFIYIIITILIVTILLMWAFEVNPRKAQEISKNQELNNYAKKYPSNLQICKDILEMLNNKNTKIEEDSNAKNCLYMVATDKIIIAGKQDNFTRIQTIAHECIHSIQNKKIQMFNFVYSNIYLLCFAIFAILGILKKLPNEMAIFSVFLLFSFLYYAVRVYLENDAMIKAKFLAEKYMIQNGSCTKEEISKITDGFEMLNNVGIKGYNFSLIFGVLVKSLILAIIFIIF